MLEGFRNGSLFFDLFQINKLYGCLLKHINSGWEKNLNHE